jgi:hypothetical protein
VLGPAEAGVEIAVFFAVIIASGAELGQPIPPGILLSASGAAFVAVVIGQAANALACRSASRPVWRLPRPSLALGGAIAFGAVA